MATHARYVQVDAPYRISLQTAELPEPGPGEVLLQARSSLISTGSELRRYRRYEGYGAFQYPVTDLGYSMVGCITAVGPNLPDACVGQRAVAVQRHADWIVTPFQNDGVRTAVPVPDGVGDDEATFGPLLRSTVNWLRNDAIEPEHTVVVVGAGLVGQLQAQAALLHTPRKLIVTDATPLRLDIAKACGAHEVINAAEVDPVAAVKSLNGGKGADVVIETVGGAYVESFEQACRMTRTGGRMVAVGMHTAPVAIPPHTIHNISIVGSQIGYRTEAAVFRRAMELLAEGRFRTGELITHRFAFEDAAEAYRLLDERPGEALGVVLRYGEGTRLP